MPVQSIYTKSNQPTVDDFQMISTEKCFEYTILTTKTLLIHQIKLLNMNEQCIDQYYIKYNIFMPFHVSKASLKRKCEFFIGRLAAKFALSTLGDYSSYIIKKGQQGEPVWPKYITGSISHSMEECTQGIAIATASINTTNFINPFNHVENQHNQIPAQIMGIDIEIKQNAEIFNKNPSMLNSLMSAQETKFLSPFLNQIPALYLILFSAKESLTKALYNKYKKLISFDAMHCIGLCITTSTLTFYLPKMPIDQKVQVNFLDLDHEIMTFCSLRT